MNKVKLSDMKSPKLCVVHHRAEEASSATRSVYDVSFSNMFELLLNLITSVRGKEPSARIVAGTMEALIGEGSVYLVLPKNESLRMFVSEDCGDNINDYPWPKVSGQFRVLSFDEADHLAKVHKLIDEERASGERVASGKQKKPFLFSMNPLPAALMNALFPGRAEARIMTDEEAEQARLNWMSDNAWLSGKPSCEDIEGQLREHFQKQESERKKGFTDYKIVNPHAKDAYQNIRDFFDKNPGFDPKDFEFRHRPINFPCRLIPFPGMLDGKNTIHSMLNHNAKPIREGSALTTYPFRLMIQVSFYTATKGLIDHDMFSVRSKDLIKAVNALHNMARGKAIYFDREILEHETIKMVSANLSELRKHNKNDTSGLFTTFIDGDEWSKKPATYKGYSNNPDGGWYLRVAMFLTVNPHNEMK